MSKQDPVNSNGASAANPTTAAAVTHDDKSAAGAGAEASGNAAAAATDAKTAADSFIDLQALFNKIAEYHVDEFIKAYNLKNFKQNLISATGAWFNVNLSDQASQNFGRLKECVARDFIHEIQTEKNKEKIRLADLIAFKGQLLSHTPFKKYDNQYQAHYYLLLRRNCSSGLVRWSIQEYQDTPEWTSVSIAVKALIFEKSPNPHVIKLNVMIAEKLRGLSFEQKNVNETYLGDDPLLKKGQKYGPYRNTMPDQLCNLIFNDSDYQKFKASKAHVVASFIDYLKEFSLNELQEVQNVLVDQKDNQKLLLMYLRRDYPMLVWKFSGFADTDEWLKLLGQITVLIRSKPSTDIIREKIQRRVQMHNGELKLGLALKTNAHESRGDAELIVFKCGNILTEQYVHLMQQPALSASLVPLESKIIYIAEKKYAERIAALEARLHTENQKLLAMKTRAQPTLEKLRSVGAAEFALDDKKFEPKTLKPQLPHTTEVKKQCDLLDKDWKSFETCVREGVLELKAHFDKISQEKKYSNIIEGCIELQIFFKRLHEQIKALSSTVKPQVVSSKNFSLIIWDPRRSYFQNSSLNQRIGFLPSELPAPNTANSENLKLLIAPLIAIEMMRFIVEQLQYFESEFQILFDILKERSETIDALFKEYNEGCGKESARVEGMVDEQAKHVATLQTWLSDEALSRPLTELDAKMTALRDKKQKLQAEHSTLEQQINASQEQLRTGFAILAAKDAEEKIQLEAKQQTEKADLEEKLVAAGEKYKSDTERLAAEHQAALAQKERDFKEGQQSAEQTFEVRQTLEKTTSQVVIADKKRELETALQKAIADRKEQKSNAITEFKQKQVEEKGRKQEEINGQLDQDQKTIDRYVETCKLRLSRPDYFVKDYFDNETIKIRVALDQKSDLEKIVRNFLDVKDKAPEGYDFLDDKQCVQLIKKVLKSSTYEYKKPQGVDFKQNDLRKIDDIYKSDLDSFLQHLSLIVKVSEIKQYKPNTQESIIVMLTSLTPRDSNFKNANLVLRTIAEIIFPKPWFGGEKVYNMNVLKIAKRLRLAILLRQYRCLIHKNVREDQNLSGDFLLTHAEKLYQTIFQIQKDAELELPEIEMASRLFKNCQYFGTEKNPVFKAKLEEFEKQRKQAEIRKDTALKQLDTDQQAGLQQFEVEQDAACRADIEKLRTKSNGDFKAFEMSEKDQLATTLEANAKTFEEAQLAAATQYRAESNQIETTYRITQDARAQEHTADITFQNSQLDERHATEKATQSAATEASKNQLQQSQQQQEAELKAQQAKNQAQIVELDQEMAKLQSVVENVKTLPERLTAPPSPPPPSLQARRNKPPSPLVAHALVAAPKGVDVADNGAASQSLLPQGWVAETLHHHH